MLSLIDFAMKINHALLVLFFVGCGKLSTAQVDSSDYKANSFYLFKTEEDFFNKGRIYRGQSVTVDAREIKYTTADSKKKKLSLVDSCSFYFGYQIGDEIQIRPDKNSEEYMYYTFGGGTMGAYCVVYGKLPNYDKQGFLQGLTAPGGWIYMYFNDRKNNISMGQMEEFLKSKPALLEKYKREKAGIEKELWERNKLSMGIKYLKLFIAEK